MLNLKVLSALLIFINATAFAQYKSEKKADSLYKAKNYGQAGKYYLRSIDESEFNPLKKGLYYNAACCYALNAQTDSAMLLLKLAISNGYTKKKQILEDSDLNTLHKLPEWDQAINAIKPITASSHDPYEAKLVTSDIKNFWKAYDLAQKDTANRSIIYKQHYVDPGTTGLQDYFAYKVRNMKNFMFTHDKNPKFYASIRRNTYSVDQQKPQMQASFVKLKSLYPEANFPDVYFVIGSFSSGGTSTDAGLLIGLDQSVRTPDIPVDELNLWQRNNFSNLKDLPHLIAHELIHFNQDGLASDTTLLRAVLVEGMADFIGELISGKTANERLHIWAKGKEKQIWTDFEKEIYLKRANNWIANSDQETADKPADLGYWVGYQICKGYYNNSADKKKAIADMLNIKDYKSFYLKSGTGKEFAL